MSCVQPEGDQVRVHGLVEHDQLAGEQDLRPACRGRIRGCTRKAMAAALLIRDGVLDHGRLELRGRAVAGTFVLVAVAAGAAVEVPGAAGHPAGRPDASRQGTVAKKSKPVRAVAPPATVSFALNRTTRARYVVLTESSETAITKYAVDNRDGKAEAWSGRSVSLIQLGRVVYAPQAKGCYISTKRPSALLPNVAGMLLPSGVAAMHYTAQGRTIHWSIKTSGKYQPHGTVTVNKAGMIISATVYSGPGVPLRALVSYPVRAPKIAAPRALCRK